MRKRIQSEAATVNPPVWPDFAADEIRTESSDWDGYLLEAVWPAPNQRSRGAASRFPPAVNSAFRPALGQLDFGMMEMPPLRSRIAYLI